MNSQKPSGVTHSDPELLYVKEIFHSIQGEGPFTGRPAVFVRLAGCNLKCPFCDTDYTTDAMPIFIDDLLTEIFRLSPPRRSIVVITGGEPFRQNITDLAGGLLDCGYTVQVETNGTLFLPSFPYYLTTIVCSPKPSGPINEQLLPFVSAIKCLVKADTDIDTTQWHFRKAPADIYVQPMDEGDDEKNKANTDRALALCLHNGYTFCPQLHKLVGAK